MAEAGFEYIPHIADRGAVPNPLLPEERPFDGLGVVESWRASQSSLANSGSDTDRDPNSRIMEGLSEVEYSQYFEARFGADGCEVEARRVELGADDEMLMGELTREYRELAAAIAADGRFVEAMESWRRCMGERDGRTRSEAINEYATQLRNRLFDGESPASVEADEVDYAARDRMCFDPVRDEVIDAIFEHERAFVARNEALLEREAQIYRYVPSEDPVLRG